MNAFLLPTARGICLLLAAGFGPIISAEAGKANIIWIVGDDLGVELGCYGNPDVKTPNTDKLAAEGIRYTNSFSTAPVCSAPRSAFITGMYQTHIGLQAHRKILRLPMGWIPPG